MQKDPDSRSSPSKGEVVIKKDIEKADDGIEMEMDLITEGTTLPRRRSSTPRSTTGTSLWWLPTCGVRGMDRSSGRYGDLVAVEAFGPGFTNSGEDGKPRKLQQDVTNDGYESENIDSELSSDSEGRDGGKLSMNGSRVPFGVNNELRDLASELRVENVGSLEGAGVEAGGEAITGVRRGTGGRDMGIRSRPTPTPTPAQTPTPTSTSTAFATGRTLSLTHSETTASSVSSRRSGSVHGSQLKRPSFTSGPYLQSQSLAPTTWSSPSEDMEFNDYFAPQHYLPPFAISLLEQSTALASYLAVEASRCFDLLVPLHLLTDEADARREVEGHHVSEAKLVSLAPSLSASASGSMPNQHVGWGTGAGGSSVEFRRPSLFGSSLVASVTTDTTHSLESTGLTVTHGHNVLIPTATAAPRSRDSSMNDQYAHSTRHSGSILDIAKDHAASWSASHVPGLAPLVKSMGSAPLPGPGSEVLSRLSTYETVTQQTTPTPPVPPRDSTVLSTLRSSLVTLVVSATPAVSLITNSSTGEQAIQAAESVASSRQSSANSTYSNGSSESSPVSSSRPPLARPTSHLPHVAPVSQALPTQHVHLLRHHTVLTTRHTVARLRLLASRILALGLLVGACISLAETFRTFSTTYPVRLRTPLPFASPSSSLTQTPELPLSINLHLVALMALTALIFGVRADAVPPEAAVGAGVTVILGLQGVIVTVAGWLERGGLAGWIAGDVNWTGLLSATLFLLLSLSIHHFILPLLLYHSEGTDKYLSSLDASISLTRARSAAALVLLKDVVELAASGWKGASSLGSLAPGMNVQASSGEAAATAAEEVAGMVIEDGGSGHDFTGLGMEGMHSSAPTSIEKVEEAFDVFCMVEASAELVSRRAWDKRCPVEIRCDGVEGSGVKHVNLVVGSRGAVVGVVVGLLSGSLRLSLSNHPLVVLSSMNVSISVTYSPALPMLPSDPNSPLADPALMALAASIGGRIDSSRVSQVKNPEIGNAAGQGHGSPTSAPRRLYRFKFTLPVVQRAVGAQAQADGAGGGAAAARVAHGHMAKVEEVVGWAAGMFGVRIILVRGSGEVAVAAWCQGWGCYVSTTPSASSLRATLDSVDPPASGSTRASRRAARARRTIVIVDDDIGALDAAGYGRRGVAVVYCCAPGGEARAAEFALSIAAPVSLSSPPRVHIITKPVGPRKLLHALRLSLDVLESSSNDVDGMTDEDEEADTVASGAKKRTDSAELKPKLDSKKIKKKKESGKNKEGKQVRPGPARPPVNVLIVEDNTINQTILSTFLKKRGIFCAVAANGKEAVEKWREGKFHLVLMDILMPIMNGIEATVQIRDIERERREHRSRLGTFTGYHAASVVIVALTASTSPSDRDAALAAGCNDYLTKPVNLPWLEKKIIEWGSMQALIDFAAFEPPTLTWDTTESADPRTSSTDGKHTYPLPVREVPEYVGSREGLGTMNRGVSEETVYTKEAEEDLEIWDQMQIHATYVDTQASDTNALSALLDVSDSMLVPT
ncbi:ssk1 response regulator receiver [Gonapodya sp. JEL0774]|nr:ssk1 response regulator receiver [Gonapodya sp. JEL0774]